MTPTASMPGRGGTCDAGSDTRTYPIVKRRGDEIVTVTAPTITPVLVNGRACTQRRWVRTAARLAAPNAGSEVTPTFDSGSRKIELSVRDESCVTLKVGEDRPCECRRVESSSADEDVVDQRMLVSQPSWQPCACPAELTASVPVRDVNVVVEPVSYPKSGARNVVLGTTNANGTLDVCTDALAKSIVEAKWEEMIRASHRAKDARKPKDEVEAAMAGGLDGFVTMKSVAIGNPQQARKSAVIVLMSTPVGNRQVTALPDVFMQGTEAELHWLRLRDRNDIPEVRTFVTEHSGTERARLAAEWVDKKRAQRMSTKPAGDDDPALMWMDSYLRDFGADDAEGAAILRTYGTAIASRAEKAIKRRDLDEAQALIDRASPHDVRFQKKTPDLQAQLIDLKAKIATLKAEAEAAAERRSAGRVGSKPKTKPAKARLGQWSEWEAFEAYVCRYRMGDQGKNLGFAAECQDPDTKERVCQAGAACEKNGSRASCTTPQTLSGTATTCVSVVRTVLDALIE